MRRVSTQIVLWGMIIIFLFGFGDVSAKIKPKKKNKRYVPGELLVKYKPMMRSIASKNLKKRLKAKIIRQYKNLNIDRVKLPSEMSVKEALEVSRNDPDVEYVEPNYYRYLSDLFPGGASGPPTDNQHPFKELWGLHNTGQLVDDTYAGTPDADIDAPEAWDIQNDCSIVIAVIDSGVDYNHPEFTGRIIAGYDFVDDDNDPMDVDGHGTHVAGTIAANGLSTSGISGICWDAQIMPLRAFDAFGIGTVDNVIEAIDWATDNGADIINASFGGYGSDSLFEYLAIAEARNAGILFVAAAGNDSQNTGVNPFYPAGYGQDNSFGPGLENILTVAASNQDDNLASFSNYGPSTVDVAAPGTNIFSTKLDRKSVWSEDFEASIAGTWWLDPPWDRAPNSSNTNWWLTDSPGGNYGNGSNISAISPEIDLSSEKHIMMTFQLKGDLAAGDLLHIETADNNGGPWTERPALVNSRFFFNSGISGGASNWVDVEVDLKTLDNISTAYVRFRLTTDGSGVRDGYYIDNLVITAADDTYSSLNSHSNYRYLNGTSMATPHVTGLAALIWTEFPGFTYGEVKEQILLGVERRPELVSKILTGGRINAYLSLSDTPAAPVNLNATTKSQTRIDLSWLDGSYGEDGFEIECKVEPAGTFQQIADVGSNTSFYSHTGLNNETTYTYRVRAYRGGNASAFSTTASATASARTVTVNSSSGSGGGGGSGGSSGGGSGGGGGGCFIATAAFDSPLHRHVQLLKKFRARYLYTNAAGNLIAQGYNRWSPPIADYIREHHWIKSIVRLMLYPLILWAGFMLSAGPIQITIFHAGVLVIMGLMLQKFALRQKHRPTLKAN